MRPCEVADQYRVRWLYQCKGNRANGFTVSSMSLDRIATCDRAMDGKLSLSLLASLRNYIQEDSKRLSLCTFHPAFARGRSPICWALSYLNREAEQAISLGPAGTRVKKPKHYAVLSTESDYSLERKSTRIIPFAPTSSIIMLCMSQTRYLPWLKCGPISCNRLGDIFREALL